MAPKKNAAAGSGSTVADSPSAAQVKSAKAPKSSSSSSSSSPVAQLNQLGDKVWNHYLKTTGYQTRLIDAFLVFLLVVGGIQFLYYILIAKDPFNAFLAGFAATVGQFVLTGTSSQSLRPRFILFNKAAGLTPLNTVSLRMQTDEQNKSDFPKITPERSFADYVFGSLILHFFCINYIN
ncbi:Dolichyl-diphosphooligosaccharide-protein glycosyltransferase subunit dad1 [Cytospora paraplurivora]|uniref:Dolichyl-diphosphooligosaccharide--protein glycosyltransferase subunit OST2 n=1 Tax=Cytospora paraplurivora TaxID=2898453 RepID=A0AAN9UCA3_9PEZI